MPERSSKKVNTVQESGSPRGALKMREWKMQERQSMESHQKKYSKAPDEIWLSCIIHPCNYARAAFSTPAFSVARRGGALPRCTKQPTYQRSVYQAPYCCTGLGKIKYSNAKIAISI